MPDHDPQSLIRRLLEPLQNLTTLHLKFNYTIEHETFLYLAKLAKQLQRLYISFPTIHIDGESSEESGIEIPEIEQTRLIEFGLDSDYAKIDLYIILILKAAPELETLLMPTFDPTRVGLITSAVRQYCPRIRDLSLGQTITDPEVTDIISSCTTGLRSFAMVNNGGFGLATMKQLFLNNWKSLTSVILEAVGLDQFRMVQDILSSCPNLREFCIDEVFMEENSGRFAVKEILKKPWVCVKLELFRVPLAGIYGSIGGEESQDQGEDYHRALYIQLAKLSRLQELDVGFSLWSEPICTTMPRFSLESGLELLEGLKELRTLVLNFTVNGTQRQELEWMCEHWPNLTRIDGIIIEEAKLWWGLKSKDNDGDDTSMPKRIRNILTACDTRYTDICFNFGR
ncbi:hypothetical protein BGX26_008433 [Mortierella sp. AD094]|nr:hypothetical protein BGX26_008433 [Mortierella sp. AD094]